MKQGALIFDERSDRYDIRFDLADYGRRERMTGGLKGAICYGKLG